MFKYYLYKFGQFCVTRLSFTAAYTIAVFVSDWHYRLSFRDRRAVRNNLKIILSNQDNLPACLPAGQAGLPVQTREVFRNFGRYLVDFFRMGKKLDLEFIKKNIKIKNIEYLDRVLKEGNGGITLTAHIGNWELGGMILCMLGYPIVGIALPHKERSVNDLFNRQREAKGMMIVQTYEAMRKCVDIIKSNKLIGLLADRDFSQNGEVLDFLGKKAFIPKGPAIFSRKTGCPIIPIFMIREADNTFTLTIEKPIYPPVEQGDKTERLNLLPIMREYTKIIEKKIKEYPTQWLMFREFWIK